MCQEQIIAKYPTRFIVFSDHTFISRAVWTLPLQQRDRLLPGEQSLCFIAAEEAERKSLRFGQPERSMSYLKHGYVQTSHIP